LLAMAIPNQKTERSYYESVKNWLEQILKEKYASLHLEVTANKQVSNVLQSQIDTSRDLIFAFLRELLQTFRAS
jgi:ribosomal protein S3AE